MLLLLSVAEVVPASYQQGAVGLNGQRVHVVVALAQADGHHAVGRAASPGAPSQRL
jgi:hypothetical protein